MKTAINHVLVIKLGALGDFIYALGPMAAIRRHHKGARITLLTTKNYAQLGRDCGYFDDVWIDHKPTPANLSGWMRLAAHLNAGAFDRVYDLQNNDRTAIYLRLFKSRPVWVGTAPGSDIRNADPDRVRFHAFEGQRQTLAMAGIKDVTLDRLDWMKTDLSRFDLKKPYVLIVPGSSPGRPEKRWPADAFVKICRTLSSRAIQPVLIGTGADEAQTRQIVQSCPQAVDLTGRTQIDDIPGLARGAKGAIGNDTGPMHMIGVTGCPTVMMFCTQSSNPEKHGVPGHETEKHLCMLASTDLASITPERVMDAFDRVIG